MYILEPLIPPAKLGGRPRRVDMREVVNAIFYILCAGCAWSSFCRTIYLPGKPFTITFGFGVLMGCGR